METSAALWAEVVTVWQTAVFGVGIGQVMLALLVFLGFLLLRQVFTRIVLAAMGGITRRTETEFDDELVEALEQPLRFVFVVVLMPSFLDVFLFV